jgi:hypothetical protein
VRNVSNNLEKLAGSVLAASRKRREITKLLTSAGFLYIGKGGWLGRRTRDVFSGFVVEGSRSAVYISTFLLPSFDNNEFISWSLRRRVIRCSDKVKTSVEVSQAIGIYELDIFHIKTSSDIINYLESNSVSGYYPIWVQYICFLRNNEIKSAKHFLDNVKLSQLHPAQIDQFNEINPYVSSNNLEELNRILERWSDYSLKIFGLVNDEFVATSLK